MATSPNSILDYQAILDAAYSNLGSTMAEADAQTSQLQQANANALAQSAINRKKGVVRSREGSSSRGLLDSSIALQGQADVNQAYDTQNAAYTTQLTNGLGQISRNRLKAQNAYTDAQSAFNRYKLLGVSVDSPGVVTQPTGDPATDPNAYAASAQAWIDATNANNAAPAPAPVSNVVKKAAPKAVAKPKPKSIITPIKPKLPAPHYGYKTKVGVI